MAVTALDCVLFVVRNIRECADGHSCFVVVQEVYTTLVRPTQGVGNASELPQILAFTVKVRWHVVLFCERYGLTRLINKSAESLGVLN